LSLARSTHRLKAAAHASRRQRLLFYGAIAQISRAALFHRRYFKPIAQELLLLGVVTSKVAEVKQRRRDCPGTVVEISPRDFEIFTKLSIVDCNDLKQVLLVEFNTRFVRNEIRYFNKDLPIPLREALRGAIHASPIVPDEMKILVAKP
jgi:hypothetical protein